MRLSLVAFVILCAHCAEQPEKVAVPCSLQWPWVWKLLSREETLSDGSRTATKRLVAINVETQKELALEMSVPTGTSLNRIKLGGVLEPNVACREHSQADQGTLERPLPAPRPASRAAAEPTKVNDLSEANLEAFERLESNEEEEGMEEGAVESGAMEEENMVQYPSALLAPSRGQGLIAVRPGGSAKIDPEGTVAFDLKLEEVPMSITGGTQEGNFLVDLQAAQRWRSALSA